MLRLAKYLLRMRDQNLVSHAGRAGTLPMAISSRGSTSAGQPPYYRTQQPAWASCTLPPSGGAYDDSGLQSSQRYGHGHAPDSAANKPPWLRGPCAGEQEL